MDGEVAGKRGLMGFMETRPDRASAYDVIRLLLTGNTAGNDAVECQDEQEVLEAERRWLVAGSLLLQKCLQLVRSPAWLMGTTVESMGNLLSSKNGVSGTFSDLLHWKFQDTEAASYRSMVSLLDARENLDEKIKPGNARYRASLCVMASKLAYENQAHIRDTVKNTWNMEFLEFFSCWNDFQDKPSTQAFMFTDGSTQRRRIVVAFRGTEVFNMDDWSVDVDLSWHEIAGVGKIHAGFMKALGLQHPGWWPNQPLSPKTYAYYAVRDKLKELLRRHPDAGFLVTGHSLGGALAALFPLVLALHGEKDMLSRLEAVYTFGQPRVGDEQLGRFMSGLLDGDSRQRYFRFVYNYDIVPRLPSDDKAVLFKHWGKCFYYDGSYKGQVVEEVPESNYFSVADFCRKRVSAGKELVRSFRIGRSEGAEFGEGWLQRVARLAGLVSPGLADHLLQDYVNCTRLGNTLEASHNKDD